MSGLGGTFRTAAGEVSVDGDAVRIDRAPGARVRSQMARWRHGGRWERTRAVARLALLLLVPALLLFRLAEPSGAVTATGLAFVLAYVGLDLVGLWVQYVRETEISLSAVSEVALDPDERELTLTFDAGTRLSPAEGDGIEVYLSDDALRTFETGKTERTMALPTDDDVREARSAFRLVGVPVDERSGASEAGRRDGRTETDYRVRTERGVVFCERCDSQVSPSDDTCPACDRALRFERPVGDDLRDLARES